MTDVRNAECVTCGWSYPILSSADPADFVNHGDCREPAESVAPCPNPVMQWVEE